jgi:hypothetical protein
MSQKQQNYDWGQNWLVLNHMAVLKRLFRTEDLDLVFDTVSNPFLPFYVPIAVYSDAD